MSRRAARVAAVEILYGADLRSVTPDDVLRERDDVDPFTAQIVEEVDDRRHELDRLIGAHSLGWTTERMSMVDRNILRVATCELLLHDVPPAAVIDEAVEIAKHFSGDDAGRFVNGVLGAVLQELAGGSEGLADGGVSSDSSEDSDSGRSGGEAASDGSGGGSDWAGSTGAAGAGGEVGGADAGGGAAAGVAGVTGGATGVAGAGSGDDAGAGAAGAGGPEGAGMIGAAGVGTGGGVTTTGEGTGVTGAGGSAATGRREIR